MATVSDVIASALKEIGVIGASETPSAEDSSDALTRLNRLVDRLATERLSIYTVTRTTWTIVASDGSYTVGPSADVDIARPVFVDKVGFINTATDPDTEYPLHRLTEDEYAAITLKPQTSVFPRGWYYNPTYANGTLILWPAPTSSTLLGVIYHPTAVTQFSALSTTVALPPGYEEMLLTNLALLLCPSYEKQPHPVLVKAAQDSLAAVKRANKRSNEISFEAAAQIGHYAPYNIRLG